MKNTYHQTTLASHETLEIHELVAFQSIGLMKLKMGLNNIQDQIYKGFICKPLKNLK